MQIEHMHLEPAHKMTVTMDDIIRTGYALAFSHGVCNTPTAVPTPLYIARESMKRATELFVYWNKKSGGAPWNIDEVIKQLTLNPTTNKVVHGLRVNA